MRPTGSQSRERLMEVDAMPRKRDLVPARGQLSDHRETVHTCTASDDRELSKQDIRQRAYEICLAGRGAPGDAPADWLQAETELRGRRLLGLT